jgi:ABC-type transport system involved in multi-copper enzyme maturation permease subunit
MHVFNTWLIANLLHPVAIILCGLLRGYWEWNDDVIYGIFQLFVYSLVFSLPCLFVAMCIMTLVKRSPLDASVKFTIWLFLCTSLPAICFLILATIISNEWTLMDDLIFVLPATLAVFIAILIRSKPFFLYIQTPQETNQQ